jgi:predicted alpha/beta superfamily hydrolase
MKKLICFSLLLMFAALHSQKSITIKVNVPDKNDVVYISGNQETLGNWNPSQIKMEKTGDLERTVTLMLNFPAEFKFTRGSWESEGISNHFESNVNFKIEKESAEAVSYRIKGWKDSMASEESSTVYKIERLHSKYFSQERLVKVYVPETYDASKKYPVLYVLDGFSLFDTAALYMKQLANADGYFPESVPACIVVGIYHEDRGYETSPDFTTTKYLEGSENLNQFIIKELMPAIASKYSVSGYNMLAGHSNTAHFVVNELFQATQPFNGIISLSLNGESQFVKDKLYAWLKSERKTNLFLGYGIKDSGFNEISKDIAADLLSGNLSADKLKVGKYNATHNQMPAVSLFDAIRFMFEQYRNFDDFAVASAKADFGFKEYAARYAKKMTDVYGITPGLEDADFDYLLEAAVSAKNKTAFDQMISYYETEKKEPYFTHLKFYYNTKMGDFESAKVYAYQMLESKDENDQNVLYGNMDKYVNLFQLDLKKPQEAIAFLEKAILKVPKNQMRYRYFIAKTAIENGIQNSKTKKDLAYCLANFKENKIFTKDDLLKLKSRLQ